MKAPVYNSGVFLIWKDKIIIKKKTMNKIMQEREFYKTADLSLAAVLVFSFPIEALDRTNPRKAYFVFRRDVGLDELVEQFWRGELKVEPRSYFDQLKIIKGRLYAEN